jgi:serine/threonine-protein kinase
VAIPSNQPSNDEPDPIGMIVDGKYDICQRVAAGGVGTVYRARHRFTGRQVALKLLNEQYTRDKIMSERFLREAKAAAEIGHPNIVEVVDAGVDEAVGVYVAFDFLEGLDLADAYRRKLLSIRQILDVGDGVLDALAAAHQAGIIHRDIKPPNIFLLPGEHGSFSVRVLDFGAAKRQKVSVEESLTTFGTVIGTPAYMSPEQASGQSVDPRTDIWSVGAVLFRGLAERPPFAERNPSLLLACIIRDTAPSLAEFRPDLPMELISVIDKSLARDPAHRWPSAQAMREALMQARASVSGAVATMTPEQLSASYVRRVEPNLVESPSIEKTIQAVPSSILALQRKQQRKRMAGALAVAVFLVVILAFLWFRPAMQREQPSASAATATISQPTVPVASNSAAPTMGSASATSSAASVSPIPTRIHIPTVVVPGVVAPPVKGSRALPTGSQRPPVVPIREYE